MQAEFHLGAWDALRRTEADRLTRAAVIERIWQRDHTVWSDSPAEIADRLGWLDIHERMLPEAAGLRQWAQQVYADGFRQAVLIGMGGSSLAPEAFQKILGGRGAGRGLELHILDTTDPAQIADLEAQLSVPETLFVVATKSGGTVETLSGYRYFWRKAVQAAPARAVGTQFAAITDPGSRLADWARAAGFRHVFENDPCLGGRYSALSHFGLAPLALLDVDVARILRPVTQAAADARRPPAANVAAQLGAVMVGLARQGRDKLTIMAPPAFAALGDWLEQLIAESLGKDGQGIVPVLGEGPSDAPGFGPDRFCVVLAAEGAAADTAAWADACVRAGHPTVTMPVSPWDMGRFFFTWEFATAVAGHCLGVHPFDQPDVEAAKVAARQFAAAFQTSGDLPGGDAVAAARSRVEDFLAQARPGDYASIQAYLPHNASVRRALEVWQRSLSRQKRMAVTLGWGPRFLHSTGQLHKGGPNNGLYLQLTRATRRDLEIPDENDSGRPLSFGALQRAQALGDAEALRAQGRRVLCLRLADDFLADLQALTGNIN